MSTTESTSAATLRSLLARLTTFRVKVWGASSDSPSMEDRDEAPLLQSHVASSLRKDGMHVVALDIDHPAWLVKSSTEGHFHLYIEVPEGIEWDKYKVLLLALAEAGVVEEGYVGASIERGHTDVRLPWIKKGFENE